MFEILLVCVSVFSIAISIHLAGRVAELHRRLKAVERLVKPIGEIPLAPPPPSSKAFSFQGRKVGILIDQDHEQPLFANVLIDLLGRENVAKAKIILRDPGPKSDYDIIITGEIVCNGFSDVYYEAELVCRTGKETICVLVEKPPHGDRPITLGKSLLTMIRDEANKNREDAERPKALA